MKDSDAYTTDGPIVHLVQAHCYLSRLAIYLHHLNFGDVAGCTTTVYQMLLKINVLLL